MAPSPHTLMLDDTLWQMGKSAEKHSNPTYMTRIAESKEFRAFLHATAEHAPSETIALFNALVDECHASQKILDKAADATRKAAAAQKTLEEAEAAKNQKADASQDAVRPTKRFKHTHQPATTFQPIQTIVGPSTIRGLSTPRPGPEATLPERVLGGTTASPLHTNGVPNYVAHTQSHGRDSSEGRSVPLSTIELFSPCVGSELGSISDADSPETRLTSMLSSPQRSIPESGEVASHTSSEGTPESAEEDHDDEETGNVTSHPDETGAIEDPWTVRTGARYEKEVGIIRNTESVVGPIKAHCLREFLSRSRFPGKKESDFTDILNECALLKFSKTKSKLLDFLENRLEVPGSRTEMPSLWKMSKTDDILCALETIKARSIDAKIHRAYGQMKVYLSVDAKVKEDNYIAKTDYFIFGPLLATHLIILADLAIAKAGNVTHQEKEEIFESHKSDFYAGKNWLNLARMFGGRGIVLVILRAGVGASHAARKWSEFQRSCLEYISGFLYSIKDLVAALGEDGLEDYCRHGHLGADYIAKLDKVKGCQPAARSGLDDSLSVV